MDARGRRTKEFFELGKQGSTTPPVIPAISVVTGKIEDFLLIL